MNPDLILLLKTWATLAGVLFAVGGVFWSMGYFADRS